MAKTGERERERERERGGGGREGATEEGCTLPTLPVHLSASLISAAGNLAPVRAFSCVRRITFN